MGERYSARGQERAFFSRSRGPGQVPVFKTKLGEFNTTPVQWTAESGLTSEPRSEETLWVGILEEPLSVARRGADTQVAHRNPARPLLGWFGASVSREDSKLRKTLRWPIPQRAK